MPQNPRAGGPAVAERISLRNGNARVVTPTAAAADADHDTIVLRADATRLYAVASGVAIASSIP